MSEPFEPQKKYAVVELVTIAGGNRVLDVSDNAAHEEEAISSAQDSAYEAHGRGENRHFGVIPITWIKQC